MDKGFPAAEAALHAGQGRLSAQSRSALNALITDLGQLGTIRAAVDSGAMSPPAAFQAYSGIIDAEFRLLRYVGPEPGAPR